MFLGLPDGRLSGRRLDPHIDNVVVWNGVTYYKVFHRLCASFGFEVLLYH